MAKLDEAFDAIDHVGWLCVCGNYVDHDDECLNQPPWGCDCSVCTELPEDECDDPDYSEPDYPEPWDDDPEYDYDDGEDW
jgi:hypothetical protein